MKFSKKRRVVTKRARTSKKVQTGKGLFDMFRAAEKDESLERYVVENDANKVKQMLEEGRMDKTTIVGGAAIPAMLNRKDIPNPVLVIAMKNWIGNEDSTKASNALRIVQLLLKKGADINIKDNTGKNLLFINSFDTYAKLNMTKWAKTILPFLLKNGGDPNVIDNKGSSFVNNVVINVLLKNKFDINMKYANGWNVAMGAVDSFLRDQVDTEHLSKIMNFTDDETFRSARALLVEKYESVQNTDDVLAGKIKQILDKYPPREAARAQSLHSSSPKKMSSPTHKSSLPSKLKNAASKINVKGKLIPHVEWEKLIAERANVKRPSPIAESPNLPSETTALIPLNELTVDEIPITQKTSSKPKTTTPKELVQQVPNNPQPKADLDRPLRHTFSKRKLPTFNRRRTHTPAAKRTPTPAAKDKKNTQKIIFPKTPDMAAQIRDLNKLKQLGKKESNQTRKARNENKLSAYYDIYSNPHDLSPTPSPVARVATPKKKGFFHGIKQMFNKTFKRKVNETVFGVGKESELVKKTAKRQLPENPIAKENKKQTKKQSPDKHKRRQNYERIEYIHLNGNRGEEKRKQQTRKNRGYEKIEYINM